MINIIVGADEEKKDEMIFSVSNNDKILFAIKSNGNLYYMINGELKELSDEKELSLAFCLLFSQIYNNSYGQNLVDKDKIIQNILKNYRERTLDMLI